MRGVQLARQWHLIRAIAASPNALTVAEIAQRRSIGFRMTYRDLEPLQATGFSLRTNPLSKLQERWVKRLKNRKLL